MNQVILSGRLTKKPELKTTTSGKQLCNFSIAIKKYGSDEADFIECVCFGKTAENLCKYQDKGNMIELTGRIENSSYTDNQGNNRHKTNVCVETINYISQGKTNENEPNTHEKQDNLNPYQEMGNKVENDLPF